MASVIVPDFSKIFANGATSVQNWTDKDYNTGWGFLGQEPPPYELFDALFKGIDEKNKYLFDEVSANKSAIATLQSNLSTTQSNYLNKNTGGTVSGSTTFSSYLYSTRTLSTTDNSNFVPNTSWVHGLINYFLTNGSNTQNNKFKSAVQDAIRNGYHGITQDFSNPNSWWTKFPNGLIIQGININPNITTNSTNTTIQLPINFPSKNLGAFLSDTSGTTAVNSSNLNDEGAKISARYTNRVLLYSGWNGGLNVEVSILAFGY